MSKFLRRMTAMSAKPEDFRPQPALVLKKPSTVDAGQPSTVDADLWRAEVNGQLFSSSRIHRIKRAQEALTHAEECVYDFLWGPKNADKDEFRLAKAGYAEIAKQTRISKRNIVEIVARLAEKGFIQIEIPPDPMRKVCAVYRVHSYKAVLESLSRQGKGWVVRAGNGVLFVRPLSIQQSSTVDAGQPSTVDAGHPSTVDAGHPSTVDAASTHLDNKRDITERQSSSSSQFPVICEAARKRDVTLDDDAVRKLIRRCRDEDPAATEDEIATFLDVKCRQLRDSPTRNIVGMLLSAVPAYFARPATELTKYRQQKAEERAKHLQIAREVLDDPESSPESRQWAQEFIANTAGKGLPAST